jgi:hypothetical protein
MTFDFAMSGVPRRLVIARGKRKRELRIPAFRVNGGKIGGARGCGSGADHRGGWMARKICLTAAIDFG